MEFITVDPAKMTLLRKMKKSMQDTILRDFAKVNLAFVAAANRFIEQIPHRTTDFIRWSEHTSIGFDVRYQELHAEYTHLNEWSGKLFDEWMKDTEIKEEEIAETPEVKKVTENKKTENYVVAHGNTTHGGARPGAGRKSLGRKKPVSIVLDDTEWTEIDSLIQKGEFKSYADYFRQASRMLVLPPTNDSGV